MGEEFRQKVKRTYDAGFAVLGLALGSELGLFRAMAELNRPCTSAELARFAGCKERYIREWLGGMAGGGFVEYEADTERFSLSAAQRSCLTNLGYVMVGMMPLVGQKHSKLKECFKLDGPLGMNQMDSPELAMWLDDFRSLSFNNVIDNVLLKDVPNIREKLESGITFGDVGSGAGRMAMLLAERFPKSTVWALDLNEQLLQAGMERAKTKNLKNINFAKGDIEKLSDDWAEKFDFILTNDVIHDLPFPQKALAEVRKCLKDGGVYSMIDPQFHSSLKDNLKAKCGAAPYMVSLYWCMTHSYSFPDSEGWGYCMGQEKQSEFLRLAGFRDFKVKPFENYNHFVCPK